jgi:hypothetical protein
MRHRERSEAIQRVRSARRLDRFATLAMTADGGGV